MKSVLVLSPHLDDAVLSAGQFLAGRPDAVVMTLFAGMPKAKTVNTSYDLTCGFGSAREAVTSRREEDKTALAILGCTDRQMFFTDDQYGQSVSKKAIADEIERAIEEIDPEFLVGPLGLVHPDHETTRDVLLEVAHEHDLPVWLYEDLPGTMLDLEAADKAVVSVQGAGYELKRAFIGDGPRWKKMLAIQAYRSQVGLFDPFQIYVPERFWKLTRSTNDATA